MGWEEEDDTDVLQTAALWRREQFMCSVQRLKLRCYVGSSTLFVYVLHLSPIFFSPIPMFFTSHWFTGCLKPEALNFEESRNGTVNSRGLPGMMPQADCIFRDRQ